MTLQTTPYRLLWFQHFHKAAGTSLIRLALANGERPFPTHRNGNLTEADGRTSVPIWEYSADPLRALVDRCEAEGVTLIATEFGVPDLQALSADPRVSLITCLREPFARFVSNYYFDLHHGYAKVSKLDDYAGSRGTFTIRNYYCWMLSRQTDRDHAIDQADFLFASRQLEMFDQIVIAEDANSWDRMKDGLGWKGDVPFDNRNRFAWREVFGLARRRRFKPIWHRLVQPVRPPAGEFATKFAEEHSFDIALYERARQART